MKPLISIVIPSRNRQNYAALVVRKILLEYPDAQVVVSDTSSDDTLRDLLPNGVDAPLLKYVRPEGAGDVVSNFEFALGHVDGRYVMFLGDDDCIGPGLRQVAEWAEINAVDAVLSYGASFLANYYWPGVVSRFYGNGYERKLFVRKFSGDALQINPRSALASVLQTPGRGLGSMPRAYHGLVSMKLIDQIVQRFGSLFGGVSPDIYSAALLSGCARNVWQVEFPFCLPGTSPASTAGSGAARNDNLSLEAHPHTAAFANLSWDVMVPSFYSPEMVWSFSLKRAVQFFSEKELCINLARIYAISLMYYPSQGEKVLAAWSEARRAGYSCSFSAVVGEVFRELGYQVGRFGRRLLSPSAGGEAISIEGLDDIGQAYDQLDSFIRRNGIVLNLP